MWTITYINPIGNPEVLDNLSQPRPQTDYQITFHANCITAHPKATINLSCCKFTSQTRIWNDLPSYPGR